MQGGDPSGTGTGGVSAFADKDGHCWCGFNAFQDEYNDRLVHDARGTLSMANSGPNSNKSQFFFALKACPHLNRKHTMFGKVVGGQAVLDRLEEHGERLAEEAKIHGKAKSAAINILAAIVLKDPVSDVDAELLSDIRSKLATRKPSTDDNANGPPSAVAATPAAVGVGKYLAPRGGPSSLLQVGAGSATGGGGEGGGPPLKKKKKKMNLDDW